MKIYIKISALPSQKEIDRAAKYLQSVGCNRFAWHQGLGDSKNKPMSLVVGTKQ